MIAEAKASIVSGWVLAKRNIGIQIRDHALGYGWVFLVPALYALGFVYLKREFMADTGVPRSNASWEVMQAFCGIMLVQFWLQLVQDMADIVGRNRALMRGLNIGPGPFVLSVAFEGVLNLGFRVALILIALVALGHAFPQQPSSWAWMTMSLLVLQLTAYALGLFLAPWSALYPDLRKALQSMALPLMLVTPIFYAQVADPQRALHWLNLVNPLSAPVTTMSFGLQDISVGLHASSLLIEGLLSFMVIAWSVVQLRWQIPVLLERLGD
jgi:ABC-type polysaccharide/polyol phosphate export permease